MEVKSSIIFCITITAATCQIYFPVDSGEAYFSSYDKAAPTLRINVKNENTTNADDLMARSIVQLTLNMNRVTTALLQQGEISNFVFSPISVAGVLALVLLASIGRTFDEIKNVMGFDQGFNIENDIFEVHRRLGEISKNIVNYVGSSNVMLYKSAIFVQDDYPIRKEYQQAVDYFYQNQVVNLNFQNNPNYAKTYINSWVSNNTKGVIPTLLSDPPDSRTKAIAVNALYFKGAWDNPFIKGATTWRPFYINGRNNKSDRMVMMMYNGGEFPYYKDKELNVEILGFPYKDSNTVMYVILPQDSSVDKLHQLENYLTVRDIERLIDSTSETEATVSFPKMKLVSTMNLAQPLKALNVKSLFDSQNANLALLSPGIVSRFAEIYRPQVKTTTQQPQSNLGNQLIFARFNEQESCEKVYDPYTRAYRCRYQIRHTRQAQLDFLEKLQKIYQQFKDKPEQINPGVYADQFIHKVFIDITEEGTEAAAVSGTGINRSGGKVTFRCDVPFIFFIYQKETKTILFWGSIKSPVPSVANDN